MSSLTLNPLTVKNAVSKGLYQSIQNINPIYDTFDRPDQSMQGSVPSSGGAAWTTTGVNAANAKIVGGQLVFSPVVNGGAFYAYMDNNGVPITHIECAFNWTDSGASSDRTYQAITMLVHDGLLGNLVHMNFSPIQGALNCGVHVTGWTGLGSPNWNLLTDGTIYRIAMDIDYTAGTVTLTGPDGSVNVYTNAIVRTIIPPTVGTLEIRPAATGFVGAFNGFAQNGPSLAPALRGMSGAAPMSEISFLRGGDKPGLQAQYHQRIGPVIIPGTPGWYTIATHAADITNVINGYFIISA